MLYSRTGLPRLVRTWRPAATGGRLRRVSGAVCGGGVSPGCGAPASDGTPQTRPYDSHPHRVSPGAQGKPTRPVRRIRTGRVGSMAVTAGAACHSQVVVAVRQPLLPGCDGGSVCSSSDEWFEMTPKMSLQNLIILFFLSLHGCEQLWPKVSQDRAKGDVQHLAGIVLIEQGR